jgi:CDP-glucose 4,6-dehydratase
MVIWSSPLEKLVTKLNFWRGKKVLVTGHTGFKGAWLCIWLKKLGAEVIGVSLDPPSEPNLFDKAEVSIGMVSLRQDIRDLKVIKKIFQTYNPDIVFHLAAQALVRYSYLNPVETYETNVMGTLNILESIRCVDCVRSAIFVTSDKCYQNTERKKGYSENEPMGGHDPYSSSKGAAELLIASFRNSYFPVSDYDNHNTAIASVRAGNVIGGGDWAQDRLIPDIIHSFENQVKVKIRNPNSIRPWQHVLEPLSGYIKLAEMLHNEGSIYAEAWNFGPIEDEALPVKFIVEKMSDFWGNNSSWYIDEGENPHETSVLKLDCNKAFNRLNWRPKWSLDHALLKIVEWHKKDLEFVNCNELCLSQIEEYLNIRNNNE